MRTTLALTAARAMGAAGVKTLEYTGLGVNIARLRLDVDRLVPRHGRIVPLADLHRAIGRAP